MESIKLSKKELKRIGENQNGYYFTGNLYNYENCIFYITRLAWRTERGQKTQHKKDIRNYRKELLKNTNIVYVDNMINIMDSIETINHDNYSIDQLYYSSGLYGNNGQLHVLNLYKKHQIVATYTMYY